MPTSSLEDDLNTFCVFRGFSPPTGDDEQDVSPSELASREAEAALAGNTPQMAERGSAEELEMDLKTLAEKVYALLRQELRLERERLVRRRPW
jgi:hypothetical protein